MIPTTNPPHNWSYQATAGAFLLGLVPHVYFTTRLVQATKNQQSVAMPRMNLETWKGKLPTALWNHLARVRGAHLNSMEVFPLFATAMVAGNVTKMDVGDLNRVAFSFLAARTVYLALYTTVKSDTLAYARSGVYAWSIGIPIVALWQAGQTAAERY